MRWSRDIAAARVDVQREPVVVVLAESIEATLPASVGERKVIQAEEVSCLLKLQQAGADRRDAFGGDSGTRLDRSDLRHRPGDGVGSVGCFGVVRPIEAGRGWRLRSWAEPTSPEVAGFALHPRPPAHWGQWPRSLEFLGCVGAAGQLQSMTAGVVEVDRGDEAVVDRTQHADVVRFECWPFWRRARRVRRPPWRDVGPSRGSLAGSLLPRRRRRRTATQLPSAISKNRWQ